MRLSKAQIKALEAVAAGKVWDEEKKEEFVLHASGIRARTVFELEELSLIERNCTAKLRNGFEWRFSLTDAGRKALEEAKGETDGT